MRNLNYIEVPHSPIEDENQNHTTWLNGRYVKLDEGKFVTYFILHKDETKVEELPDGTTIEKVITLAAPIRVAKGITLAELEAQVGNTEALNAVIPLFVTDNYEDIVVECIRKMYSLNQELAILRQKDEKLEEYKAYYNYAEQVKKEVKDLMGKQ